MLEVPRIEDRGEPAEPRSRAARGVEVHDRGAERGEIGTRAAPPRIVTTPSSPRAQRTACALASVGITAAARSTSSTAAGVIALDGDAGRPLRPAAASWPSSSSRVSSPSQPGRIRRPARRPAALEQRAAGQHHRIAERARKAGLGSVAEHVAAHVHEQEQVDSKHGAPPARGLRDARRADAGVDQDGRSPSSSAMRASANTAPSTVRVSGPASRHAWCNRASRRRSPRRSADQDWDRSAAAPSSRRP